MSGALRAQVLPALTLLTTLITFVLAQIETLSINPTYPHGCVNECVKGTDRPLFSAGGIESVLGCAAPVANKCFCVTASALASSVESWIPACATERCSRGDLSDDMNAMKSIYASYCLQAGFTAPIVSTLHAPATTTASSTSSPKDTSASSAITSTPTTTQVTLVTETAPSLNSGSSMQGKFLLLTLMLAWPLAMQLLQVLLLSPRTNISKFDWKNH